MISSSSLSVLEPGPMCMRAWCQQQSQCQACFFATVTNAKVKWQHGRRRSMVLLRGLYLVQHRPHWPSSTSRGGCPRIPLRSKAGTKTILTKDNQQGKRRKKAETSLFLTDVFLHPVGSSLAVIPVQCFVVNFDFVGFHLVYFDNLG